jgi:hypothetical protein
MHGQPVIKTREMCLPRVQIGRTDGVHVFVLECTEVSVFFKIAYDFFNPSKTLSFIFQTPHRTNRF